MPSDIVKAPWTSAQVRALNLYQAAGVFHPFTCGGVRLDGHACRETLVATEAGWDCPLLCGYTQDWAHAFMADTEATEKSVAVRRQWSDVSRKHARESEPPSSSGATQP